MIKRRYWGITLFVLVAIVALVGPWLAPYAVDDVRDMPFAPPAWATWAGSDYLGADVLSRVLSGGQHLLLLACLSVLLAWLIGGLLGMCAALKGGLLDRVLRALADVLLSVPGLLLLTLIVTFSGRGYSAALMAAILMMLPDIFRLVRAATLQQLQQDYVEMAHCRGESTLAILCREIAPNLLPLLSADVGIRLLSAIFIFATASFLGLGAVPPMADWGLMIMENRQGLTIQPWATLAPVAALLLLLLPLNLSLDSLFATSPTRRQLRTSLQPTTTDTRSVLTLEALTLQLPNQTLLQEVSLQVKPGEIVALVGASGSGKSTLLRAALGHFPDTTTQLSGSLTLAGHALALLSARALRRVRAKHVGFVPQDPRQAMMPTQTVGAYLRLIGDSRSVPAARRLQQTQACFQQLGLPTTADFLRRYPHELSGGQRQRVMVVAAMLGFPALLVMDEPTSALDGVSTQAVMQWIASIARARGMAVLFVAHDLPQACQTADRIAVMDRGRLVEQQRSASFLQSPASPAGQRLLAAWQHSETPLAACSAFRPLLISDQLRAWYGTRCALAPLQLTLGRGETLTLAGRSGCGKTTLLRSLAGLHPRVKGHLLLQDAVLPLSLRARSAAQKRMVQYIAQNPASSLNPFYPVQALLARPLRLSCPDLDAGQRQSRIVNVLAQVGLTPDLLPRRVSTLSGGQQQRVAVARALMTHPDILLCDEVTSALDGPARLEMVQLLQHLQQHYGLTLLIVTHDLTLPAQLGGTLLVMDAGRVVEQGNAVDVLAHPQHPITRQLVNAAQLSTGHRV